MAPMRAAVAVGLISSAFMLGPYMFVVVPLPDAPPAHVNLSAPARYDIKVLDAPAATGQLLQILSHVFTAPIIGPALTRILLNDNNVWHLRELSAQIPSTVVFKPLPTYELGPEELAEHADAARLDFGAELLKAISQSRRPS